jgi:hypothetical protein
MTQVAGLEHPPAGAPTVKFQRPTIEERRKHHVSCMVRPTLARGKLFLMVLGKVAFMYSAYE